VQGLGLVPAQVPGLDPAQGLDPVRELVLVLEPLQHNPQTHLTMDLKLYDSHHTRPPMCHNDHLAILVQ
jgi:hypothetical protein